MNKKEKPNLNLGKKRRERPKSLRELPRFLVRGIKEFTSRLLYIIKLVWETSPAILILMALMALLEGVLPVVGAYISRDLLNAIASLIGDSAIKEALPVLEALRPVIILLIFELIYMISKKLVFTHIVTEQKIQPTCWKR